MTSAFMVQSVGIQGGSRELTHFSGWANTAYHPASRRFISENCNKTLYEDPAYWQPHNSSLAKLIGEFNLTIGGTLARYRWHIGLQESMELNLYLPIFKECLLAGVPKLWDAVLARASEKADGTTECIERLDLMSEVAGREVWLTMVAENNFHRKLQDVARQAFSYEPKSILYTATSPCFAALDGLKKGDDLCHLHLRRFEIGSPFAFIAVIFLAVGAVILCYIGRDRPEDEQEPLVADEI